MKDYSDGRPGWQEALAIMEAGMIANQTDCPVNLLHLAGIEAVDAAKQVTNDYPHWIFCSKLHYTIWVCHMNMILEFLEK
jgi:dihydroorotase-like cyclic amidohydrolase